MVDALSDRALVQSFVEKLRYKHVSYLLNLVAAPGNSFHANAQGTKFFNPTPNSRAGNADFARDLRSADHNHRVVGKQRQQRVDATVSRPTQICLRHNNLGNLACDTWLEVRVVLYMKTNQDEIPFKENVLDKPHPCNYAYGPRFFSSCASLSCNFSNSFCRSASVVSSPFTMCSGARLRNVWSSSRCCFEAMSLESRSSSLRRRASSAL